MDFKIKDMSYGTLISHTFPGFLFGCQIVIAIKLFAPPDITNRIFIDPCKLNNTQLIIISLISFAISTILGSILDSIHNLLFLKYNQNSLRNEIDIIKSMSIEKLEMYKVFIEYDPWFAFESYANIGIALTPGIIFLPWWLFRYRFTNIFIGIFIIIYLSILFTLFYVAKIYCRETDEIEKALIEQLKKGNADGGAP